MLKLRKPFSQKVHLHIRQDLLEKLWEKYIPSSSDKYGQIQLIHLDTAGEGQAELPRNRIWLTIQLVLKNRMVQMAMDQYPAALFPGQRRMQDSLRRMEKYYLTQIKSSDLLAFQQLNRYITLLDQTEITNRRYSHWQRENQLIEKQWKEYQMLSLFSVQIQDFLQERSLWTVRKLEKEYIASLTETEYQTLTEGLIWQERESFIHYLKTCDEVQCRQIIERLSEERELCKAAAIRTGVFEALQKEKRDSREIEERDGRNRASRRKFSGRKYARIKPEKKETTIYQILDFVQGQSVNEKLSEIARSLEQKEFQLFYQHVANLENVGNLKNADPSIVIWKAEKESMISCLEEMTSERVEQIWKQIQVNVAETYKVLQEKYHREMAESFHSQVQTLLEQESFREIAELVNVEQLTHMVFSSENTDQIIQTIEGQRELCREEIKRREEQALEVYQEIYGEFLTEKDSEFWRQESMTQVVKEMFQNRHQGERTTEEILTFCEWSRFLLESFSVNPEQREILSKTSQKEIEVMRKSSQEQTEVTRKSSQEQTEIILKSSQEQTEVSQEWIHLIREINEQIEERVSNTEIWKEEDRFQREKVTLFWQENAQKDQRIQKGQRAQKEMQELLVYVQELKEEKKREFLRDLSELILFWNQIYLLQSSVLSKPAGISIESAEISMESIETESIETDENRSESREITELSYQQLWEWGEALLFHSEQEAEEEKQDLLSFSDNGEQREEQENLQTRIIRSQIEAAKNRNYLQQLVMQINHRVSSESIKSIKEDHGQGERVPLVYTDSQLGESSIQNLLSYLRKLDETQYETFVKELSQITKIQQVLYFGPEESVSTVLKQMIQQKNQNVLDFVSRRQKERYQMLIEKLRTFETAELEKISVIKERPSQTYLSAAYPVLAYRIQEYEEQQIRIQQEERKKFEQVYFERNAQESTAKSAIRFQEIDRTNLETGFQKIDGSVSGILQNNESIPEPKAFPEYESALEPRAFQKYESASEPETFQEYEGALEPGAFQKYETPSEPRAFSKYEIVSEPGRFQDYERGFNQEILQHSIQRTQVMEEEQQRMVQRVREEAIQLKTAQDQLDQKMKEVELQLRKVESQSKAKEDTRAFAEQVKNQLYEELHVEKLRRGLI